MIVNQTMKKSKMVLVLLNVVQMNLEKIKIHVKNVVQNVLNVLQKRFAQNVIKMITENKMVTNVFVYLDFMTMDQKQLNVKNVIKIVKLVAQKEYAQHVMKQKASKKNQLL